MKVCPVCGAQDEQAGEFCAVCGSSMSAKPTRKEKKFLSFFMEKSEEFVCALGNGYLKHYLSGGGLRTGFAAVSNKRVYFKGKCYYKERGHYKAREEERVVDVKDVTGTGYVRIKNHSIWIITLIIAALIAVFTGISDDFVDTGVRGVLLVAGTPLVLIVGIATYFIRRKTLFEIQFAGGIIAFDSKWYNKSEVDDFQRDIRLLKDALSEAAEPMAQMAQFMQQATPVQMPGSMADELIKYADLLDRGAISQAEYDQVKMNLLKPQK